MLPRKRTLIQISLLLASLISTSHGQSNSRSYDTNDWIPVQRPSVQTEVQPEAAQKRPTGRVLNLPAPDQKRFFPQDQTDLPEQPYRVALKQTPTAEVETQQHAQILHNQRQIQQQLQQQQQIQQQLQQQALQLHQQQQPLKYQQHDITTFVPNTKQQIVLPPELQSFISQGQSYLSPQKINAQLLPTQNAPVPILPAQNGPTLQHIPTQIQVPLNVSQFNPRDIIQNINLGLYGQEPLQQHQILAPQALKQPQEPEEVQLLYVPLENLRQRQQKIAFPTEQVLVPPSTQRTFDQTQHQHPHKQHLQPQQVQTQRPQTQRPQTPLQHKQVQLQNIEQDFIQQALQAQRLQEQLQQNIRPQTVPQNKYSPEAHSVTTSAPKKRKPHQPPLAVYMESEGHKNIKVGDVLALLKDAKSIAVQDSAGPDSPQVFVGPSHLEPPEGYTKFELPYLSSVENNRVERKVDQLPFFVAPLSYKAPLGYSKIPLPAPHVGSVVINNLQAENQETTTVPQYIPNQNLETDRVPYQPEGSSVRTRGRQRQPSRATYTSSTVQTPLPAEIPYGPLPPKESVEPQSIQPEEDPLIPPNPYGPTQFVQSSTPALYDKPVSLPDQIFATKNRFSTTPPSYHGQNVQNFPSRQSQYNVRTEPTPIPSTLAGPLTNDKYTVLEQFPIAQQKPQPQEPTQRVINRQNLRARPTQNSYIDEVETALPLVHNTKEPKYEKNVPSRPTFAQFQPEYDLSQEVIAKKPQISPEQYSQVEQQTSLSQQIPSPQVNIGYEEPETPVHHSSFGNAQTRLRGGQQQVAYEEPQLPSREHGSAKTKIRGQQQVAYDDSQVLTHPSTSETTPTKVRGQQQVIYEEPQVLTLQSSPAPIQTKIRGQQQVVYEDPEVLTHQPTPSTTQTKIRGQQQVLYENPQVLTLQPSPASTQTKIRGQQQAYDESQVLTQQPTPATIQAKIRGQQQVVYEDPDVLTHQPSPSSAPTRTRGQQFIPEIYYEPEPEFESVHNKAVTPEAVVNQPQNIRFSASHKPQVTRGRGYQHFTPETYYKDDYESSNVQNVQNVNVKINEPEVTVTKEPLIEFHVPVSSTLETTDVKTQQYIPENYYQNEQSLPEEDEKEYTLPSKLPPISPQLPGLINSLQDQAIRPLLAPLLIPPSEEPPITELDLDYYSSTHPPEVLTTTTTTTTTTTQAPITETTTQFKRTRGRQRATRPTASYDYVHTTPSSRRSSSYRGRRPYNSQTRQQDYTRQRDNVVQSSTSQPEIATEATTRTPYNRNRQSAQRERQYVSSTTESPRRTASTRNQRFRSRGRPMKVEEEYTERPTTEIPIFKQPALEGGFQASVPVIPENVQISEPAAHTEIPVTPEEVVLQKKPQQEQALLYVQNLDKYPDKHQEEESNPVPFNPEVHIPRQTLQQYQQYYQPQSQQFFQPSTVPTKPLYQSTISASAPENNIIHDSPVLVNPTASAESLKITQVVDHHPPPPVETNLNVPRVNYEESPEINEPEPSTTTEFTRIRSRVRGKTRGRVSQRYQPSTARSTTTTTTQRTTTESSKEEEDEFYGFFRPPQFAKPTQVDYKPSSELRTTQRPIPTVAYLHRPTEEPRRVYISSSNAPVSSTSIPYFPTTYIDDNRAEPNIQAQYISSTIPPLPTTSEEDTVEIKPVTRRPSSNFRRPTGTRQDHEISAQTSDKYFVRPTKRPETQTQRVTRIRGRIRKPTRTTTSQPLEPQPSFSSPRSNELEISHSEEYIPTVKSRQRVINRGRAHFQAPGGGKSITEEPESPNYPASFLQNQELQHAKQTPVAATTVEVPTQKSAFQLTIESEESEEEYGDQVPYPSVNKPRVLGLEDGEESKYSAKFVEKPPKYNYIVSEGKSSGKEASDNGSSTGGPLQGDLPPEVTTTEVMKSRQSETEKPPVFEESRPEEAIFKELRAGEDHPRAESWSVAEEAQTEKPKSRRRGAWRLVKLRPVGDDFESAESQNVGTVFTNDLHSLQKPVRKYHVVKRIRTTTPREETTTSLPDTTLDQVTTYHQIAPSTERSIFAPLYEIFGFNPEDDFPTREEPSSTIQPTESNTEVTTNTDSPNESEDLSTSRDSQSPNPETTTTNTWNTTLDEPYTTPQERTTQEGWQTRIIGTSTTTEVSHETEICYRGRCVKSASEDSSEGF